MKKKTVLIKNYWRKKAENIDSLAGKPNKRLHTRKIQDDFYFLCDKSR